MMVLSTVFFFSYFIPLRELGALMMAGFFLGVLGDIWILRALLPNHKSLENNP